ncbi:MAG: protein-S-isoprenylcysteine O-methyltransferase Ste14 [Patiriisocius sp.]|jgi:protein-S-isoprenylcysteine O-methyltransferase Ste14
MYAAFGVGWLMVIWFTPHISASHLFFATGVTIYILGAISFEERDLIRFHPECKEYRKRVGKLLPRFKPPLRNSAPNRVQPTT